MDERLLKWLYDIQLAINEIESYFENEPKDFLKYQENLMLKRAIERDLEIIGEAMNRILKADSKMEDQITSARSIVNLRNQVIHSYDSISDENIWSVLIKHIPILKEEVDLLIDSAKT